MAKLTPMMAQYMKIKEEHSDAILLYRLGDFYEMFFEDAKEAAKILQITLTSRNKKSDMEVPMCGVPFHALDQYLPKLTKAGKKVAICDQVTAPTGKGIVEREVIRIVTPGTTFDDGILDQKTNNYVACIVRNSDKFAVSYADVTTGMFRVTELDDSKSLEAELGRIGPAEVIAPNDTLSELSEALKSLNIYGFPFEYFAMAKNQLLEHFGTSSLESFGLEGRKLAIQAAGMLFDYLKETQRTDLKHIQSLNFYQVSEFMPLDEACITNLELFYTNRDAKKEGSLISVIDQTVTAMGGRLLRNWLLHPLLDKSKIQKRLNEVDGFTKDSNLLRNLREKLAKLYDIERLLSRLSLGTGNARDLIAMKQSLALVPEIAEMTKCDFADLSSLVNLIESAISEEAPATVREGKMLKDGYHSELDELRAISGQGKTFIQELQKREIERTGITSLKVKFNKVFGYYIEVSRSNSDAVPDDYIRKQTLVNAERYITPELKEYEEKVLTAEDRIKTLEYELFYEVRLAVVKEILKIQTTAKKLARLDLVSSFAFLAEKNNYAKPQITEENELEIIEGRHPVVEQIGNDFVPNDCRMDELCSFVLITGPNMGGKSTYLRQIALCVLMAQIGSYVPAKSATIGIVDRIFTRVGASDNLAKGQSTFMVEMQESAYIMHHATERSLVILDEVGRGTSTYDGVSIAWAISEYLHSEVGAKTLFATHYHELIELADNLDKAVNMSVAVRENQEEGVVFLYKIVEGGVDKSYGIEVAKLAGMPNAIVARARGVLDELETKHIQKSPTNPQQMEIFEQRLQRELESDLQNVNVDGMTPLEAIQKLDEIKKKFSK